LFSCLSLGLRYGEKEKINKKEYKVSKYE